MISHQTEHWFRDSPCSLTLRRLEESEQTSTVHPVLQTGSPAGADLCLRTVDTHLGSQSPVPPCNTTAGDTWHHLEEKIVSFHGSFLTLKVIVYIFHRWQDETQFSLTCLKQRRCHSSSMSLHMGRRTFHIKVVSTHCVSCMIKTRSRFRFDIISWHSYPVQLIICLLYPATIPLFKVTDSLWNNYGLLIFINIHL